jgi:hypothetical protein
MIYLALPFLAIIGQLGLSDATISSYDALKIDENDKYGMK